jgi:flagellar basal body-associated protein FliL
MTESRYEKEEYLEQNEDELEAARHRKKLIVLAIMAVLVVAGVVLTQKLRMVSQLEDCLMTHATNCNDLVQPPKPVGVR